MGGPHGFSGVMNSALPRKRLIAHVLIRDAAGRVLLCETQFKPDWELPGGIVEPGEAPRSGAIREVREELGIDRPLGPLLVADWLPPYLGWDDAVEMIFDGGLLAEAELSGLVLQPTEIRQVRFCTLDEAAAVLTPLAHRRLTVAAGLAPGQFAYLEDGRVSSPGTLRSLQITRAELQPDLGQQHDQALVVARQGGLRRPGRARCRPRPW